MKERFLPPTRRCLSSLFVESDAICSQGDSNTVLYYLNAAERRYFSGTIKKYKGFAPTRYKLQSERKNTIFSSLLYHSSESV